MFMENQTPGTHNTPWQAGSASKNQDRTMTGRQTAGLFLAGFLLAGPLFYQYGRSIWGPVWTRLRGRRSVAQALELYGEAARERLLPWFEKAGADWPPKGGILLVDKAAARLELWVQADNGYLPIRTYPVLALSGGAGPKLREGDRQVPEGIYSISGLNPNSSYHLSLKLDYPNLLEQKQARAEGRDPGGQIFIHGKAVSIGCLAMGDRAVEELFVLAAESGRQNWQVAIAPHDLRSQPAPVTPDWMAPVYRKLEQMFRSLPEQQ
jgi:hypothetical protein